MSEPESKIAEAERHVREGTERVARQAAIAVQLKKDGHQEAAREARELLATLEHSLRLACEHLRRERKEAGIDEPQRPCNSVLGTR